ncbi:MAG: DUF4288 domain-containing protein [Bacteroidetes bacterium]|nr:DUF4288 domain-containing protein [Bacteroidota bacterium]
MKKAVNIDDWIFTKKLSDKKRLTDVSIHLKYPEIKGLIKYSPTERKNKIKQDLQNKLKKLIDKQPFTHYSVIGTKTKPRGVRTTISLFELRKISRLDFVQTIFINNVTHARKKRQPTKSFAFYCVRMTAAIEIEGRKKGLQTIEERFVLVKAHSFEDAYKKIEKQKKSYAEPYLNSSGELVRWKTESLDDCYLTDICTLEDLDNPEGVEVFSALKNRRLTPERYWDGK